MSSPPVTSDRPSRVQQFYGYAVCLIAIVTMLMALSSLVDAVFERANPLQASAGRYGYPDASLTSFEAFRATQPPPDRQPPERAATGVDTAPAAPGADTLSTSELRVRYQAIRADRIERVTFDATRKLVGSSLLMLLAIALFTWHWRWLRAGAGRDA